MILEFEGFFYLGTIGLPRSCCSLNALAGRSCFESFWQILTLLEYAEKNVNFFPKQFFWYSRRGTQKSPQYERVPFYQKLALALNTFDWKERKKKPFALNTINWLSSETEKGWNDITCAKIIIKLDALEDEDICINKYMNTSIAYIGCLRAQACIRIYVRTYTDENFFYH